MRRAMRMGLVALIAAATAARATAGEPAHHFFTTSDGVKIHYMTLGEAGSWVVLIHGYTDTAERMWFRTGIAAALAANHRVVALDNRNHGQSDHPEPNGVGRAEDVIELMDHLSIARAHIHGYSMGGGITGRLLASHPERLITAGFGGSGIAEDDDELRARASALDPAMPAPQGAEAAAFQRLRERASARRPAAEGGDGRPAGPFAGRPRLEIDLTKVTVPVIAINGEFDRPYSKTHRMWRELKDFTNVILPGRNHMSAIAVGVPMDPTYVDSLARFINGHDVD